MQSIPKAVRRLFSVQGLLTLKAALLRLVFVPPAPQPMPQAEPECSASTPMPEEACTDEPSPDEKFAAWEAERAAKLDQASTYEQKGLRLLARAALLRASVKCDDRGETFIAEELRELADDTPPTQPNSEAAWERPVLRIVAADDVPANRGA
jgi:hypothetical protein